MKNQFRSVNRFITRIKSTSAIDTVSETGTFSVEDTTVFGFSLPQGDVISYVTVDFAQSGKEEIFRITNITGDVMTFDRRIPVDGFVRPSHVAGASVRFNDVADILNDMGRHIDTFGYTYKTTGTQTVTVSGGVFNNSGTVYNISGVTFVVGASGLADNTTNYIHFNLVTRVFVTSTSSTYGDGVCFSSVVVSGGVIGTITDLRPGFASSYGPFPSQTGNSGKALFTDGVNTSWQNFSVFPPLIGEMRIWTTNSSPNSNWMICDGSAISRTVYASLFSVLGLTYGSGDGSTTFNIPNTKGRVLVGRDSSHVEFDTLGETGGAKTHMLTIDEIPSHRHGIKGGGSGGSNYGYVQRSNGDGGSGNYDDMIGFSPQPALSNVGGGQAHNNLQPYITMNYIICVTT